MRKRESDQLKTVLELHDLEIHQKISKQYYERLKNDGEEKHRSETSITKFDARNERIETGAVVKNCRGQRGVERGPGECYQWKAKGKCSCEEVRVVIGVEAPLGGVAQVILHGVQVIEVGLQVREHQDREEEEDGEGQVEVEREVEENQRQTLIMACR